MVAPPEGMPPPGTPTTEPPLGETPKTVTPPAETPTTETPAPETPEAPATNAEPKTYEQWMTLGREALAPPKEGDNQFGQRVRWRQAADAFEHAATVAPDDVKKFSSLLLAGEYFGRAERDDDALRIYELASHIGGLNSIQKSDVLMRLADMTFARDRDRMKEPGVGDAVRALYEAVLEIPDLENPLRERAMRGLAYSWSAQGLPIEAALAEEKLSNLPHLSGPQATSFLREAVMFLERSAANKAANAKAASELLDRVFPRLLKSENNAERHADMILTWGDLMIRYGDTARGLAVWATLADDAKAAPWDRARAIDEIVAQRIKDKQYDLALKAWDRAGKWERPEAKEPNWTLTRAYSKAQVYSAQGNESAARQELEAILKMSGIDEMELATARYLIARSHLRERDALKKAGNADAKVLDDHLTAAITDLDKVLAQAGSGGEMSYQAALTRAQIELDRKQSDKARKILLQTASTLDKNNVDYMMPIMKAVSKTYYLEGRYADAMRALAKGLLKAGPDDEANRMAAQLLREAMKNSKWDEARKTLEVLKSLGLDEREYWLFGLEIEVAAQNRESALAAVAELDKLQLDENAAKLKTDLAAKIPAEGTQPTPAASTPAPETTKPPEPAPANPPPVGPPTPAPAETPAEPKAPEPPKPEAKAPEPKPDIPVPTAPQ